MASNAKQHHPLSVHTKQVEEDFVASALLALKQGPSVITLARSSSWTSLSSSGTVKEHRTDAAVSNTQDVHVPAATTKEAATQESSLPLQSSTTESSSSRASGKSPVPHQESTKVSDQRIWPHQELREKTPQMPNTSSSRNKGIIQRRWSNMKNINENMEYKPYVRYRHPSIIAVPPLRPFHRPPIQVTSHPPPPPGIAYRPVYDTSGTRRVSDAAAPTNVASASFNAPPVINQTVSNDDDYDHDHVGSSNGNENSGASVNSTIIHHYDTLSPSQAQELGEGSSTTSRNGGPLSQIYNERRNLVSFYRPIQHQLGAKQARTAAATSTHYGRTTHAPPINNNNKKKPRTAPARIPKHITNYLKEWMNANIDYPYPSEKEKEMLMYETGIDRKRLDVWLRNNRNRYVKVKRKQQSSLVFP